MKKKYNFEENPENNTVREPMAEYRRATEIKGSPALTEEELKDTFTTEEAKEYVFNHIHKLFNK